MKKIRCISIVVCLSAVLLISVSAYAELVDNGDGTITDTDTGLMWMQDANYAYTSGYTAQIYGSGTDGVLYWDDAMNWVENLVYAGYDNWKLPSTPGTTWGVTNEGDLGHMFYDENIHPDSQTPFINLKPSWYWTDNTYEPYQNHWAFVFNLGQQHDLTQDNWSYVWAVRVVPEPISSTLFIIGGTILGFRRYWNRKSN